MSDKLKAVVRVLCGALILFVGTTMAVTLNSRTDEIGILGRTLGLAFIVAGCVSVLREAVFLPLRSGQILRILREVRLLLLRRRECMTRLSGEREGHPHYHRWVLEKEPQELFFAGHSVLHQVKKDFDSRKFQSVDRVLKQKLSEGCKIRILFLDVTWELISAIAAGEGQEANNLRTDIATTLGMCKDIWRTIKDKRLAGDIEIRTCRELVQYAFNYSVCRRRKESEMLVGFYFAGILGKSSPLFLVEGEETEKCFQEHFDTIFRPTRDGSKCVLAYSREGRNKEFNKDYYNRCREALSDLGPDVVDKLCPPFADNEDP